MHASRLLSILLLLQARGRINATALAEELEVSVRTIYRDMNQLSAAGVPVFADRGSAGGFQLMDGYKTQLTGLTAEEASALFLFGLPNAASDLGLGEALTGARRKIDAALPAERRRGADAVASRFHLDTNGWFKPIEKPDFLPTLARAVWSERRIVIHYTSWNGQSTQDLAPLGIVLKAGVWYLVALGRKQSPATYRVSAIHSLQMTEVTFTRPADFDLQDYWAVAVKEFAQRLHRATATLRVSDRGFELLGKLGPDISQAAEKTRTSPDHQGWTVVQIPVERTDNAVCDILSLGTEAELVAPTALVHALAQSIRQLAERYAQIDASQHSYATHANDSEHVGGN
jgi:predicted DNA-binding transcriptional regulator YafY